MTARLYYRTMTPDQDGQPTVGRSHRRLGVTPADVQLLRGDLLAPGAGGMSVAPGSIENLPAHRGPRGWGPGSTGHRNDRVYSITIEEIEVVGLTVRLDTESHGLVEPRQTIPFRFFEVALTRTRPSWVTAWPA